MRKNIAILLSTSIWALSGCSALQGIGSGPPPVEVRATPTGTVFIAPTLPPEYTETPTATVAPTKPPTPTPFTVVETDDETPESTETGFVPTPAFTFTSWERFEASRFNLAMEIPNTLRATVLGQNIIIASPSSAEVQIPLDLEYRVDATNSFRLPRDVNPTDPRSVLEGVINELETTYENVSMIRAVSVINIRGYPAAEAAARTRVGEGTSSEETLWYLAVIVFDETVVRVYASSPAEVGSAYLIIAERITDSLEYFPES